MSVSCLFYALFSCVTAVDFGSVRPVHQHKGDAVDLTPHAGERPVTAGDAGDHRPFHVWQLNTVVIQVVFINQYIEGIRGGYRAIGSPLQETLSSCDYPPAWFFPAGGKPALPASAHFFTGVPLHCLLITCFLAGQGVVNEKGSGKL